MRRTLPLLFALTLLLFLALVLWFAAEGEAPRSLAPEAPLATQPLEPRAQPSLNTKPVPPHEPDAEPDAMPTGSRAAVALTDSEDETYAKVHVFGSLVDPAGEPVAGAKVSLNTVGEPWITGVLPLPEVPELELHTDATGRFEFTAPLPTSSWISLDVRPPAYFTRAGLHFGLAGGRNEEPLRAGDNDLGRIVLGRAGAFEGRVFDADGVPLDEARVSLDGAFPGGYVLSGRSGPDGHYRVDHVPAGSYQIDADKKGFLTSATQPIEVVGGQLRTGPDFRLERAPRLEGVVMDGDGRSLAGVKLWCWPIGGGMGAGAKSQGDGRFTIFLPQDEPYTITAEAKGFVDFDSRRPRSGDDPLTGSRAMLGGEIRPSFASGSTGIEVHLVKPSLTTFRVVDASTGAPLERYGLVTDAVRSDGDGWRSSWTLSEEIPARDHPDGLVQLPGDPRYHDFAVQAPGYGGRRGKVIFDAGQTGFVTIALEPAGRITGRLMLAGKPVALPAVQLSAGRVPKHANAKEADRDEVFGSSWAPDLDKFAGRLRQVAGDGDGRFVLEDLTPGTYRVVLRAPGMAPRTLYGLFVASGQTLELGDVEASPPASIHGRLLTAHGRSPAGMTVKLGDADFGDSDTKQTIDASGEFVFEGLAAGSYWMWVDPQPGVLVETRSVEVVLTDGEARWLDVDLGPGIPFELTTDVFLGGAPLEGSKVSAVGTSGSGRHWAVGRTNAAGRAVGELPPIGELFVEVVSPLGLVLGRSTERVVATPAGHGRIEATVTVGRLTVSLDAEPETVSGWGRLTTLTLRPETSGRRQKSLGLEADRWSGANGRWTVELGQVEVGPYAVTLTAGGRVWSGEVEIASGQLASCTLTP